MAYSLIASVGAGSAGGLDITTGAINTVGADLIVVGVTDYATTVSPCTVVDSAGNSYFVLVSYSSTNCRTSLFIPFQPITTSASHTFTAETGGLFKYPVINVQAWSGSLTASSPLDTFNGTFSNSATSLQPGSITPTQDDSLIVTAIGDNASNTFAINGGFTISTQVDYNGQHFGGGLAYLIQTTAAAANPTWTWSASTDASVSIRAFKATASVAGGQPTMRRWGGVPHVGGQGIGGKGTGRMWGRTRSGLTVPRRFQEMAA